MISRPQEFFMCLLSSEENQMLSSYFVEFVPDALNAGRVLAEHNWNLLVHLNKVSRKYG